MGGRGLIALAGTALAVVLAGCSSTTDAWHVSELTQAGSATPATCQELTEQVVDAVQRYVDGFEDADTPRLSHAAAGRRVSARATTADLQDRAGLDCAPDDLADLARVELSRLDANTPVQDAIAAAFRADPLDTVDPADTAAVAVTVGTATGLAEAVATAGRGSVITLEPGTYALPHTLVLLRPITIAGAGVDATHLTSTAAGAALVAATPGNVRITDLTLEHVGTAPASTVIVAGGGYDLQRVRITGGITDDDGTGGFGVILQPAANPVTGGNLTQTLRDVVLADNLGGGLVVGGSAAPNIREISVDGESGCGLCWVQDARGHVDDATVTGGEHGIRASDAAAPRITGLTVDGTRTAVSLRGTGDPHVRGAVLTGNDVGIDLAGSGRPVLTDNEVVASSTVGIRVAGRSQVRLDRATVIGPTEVALAVGDDAAPVIRGAVLTTTGDVGISWTDRATGTASGLVVRGARVGIRLGGESAAVLDDVLTDQTIAASLVAQDRAGGRVIGLSCTPGAGGVVALARDSGVELTDSRDCRVVEVSAGLLG